MVSERKNPPQELQDIITSEKAKTVFDTEAQSKLKEAHDAIAHPDQFAEVFCKAADTQTRVKKVIREEINEAVTRDSVTRTALKGVIKELEKEEIWIFGKRIGLAIWSIALILVGAIIAKYIK